MNNQFCIGEIHFSGIGIGRFEIKDHFFCIIIAAIFLAVTLMTPEQSPGAFWKPILALFGLLWANEAETARQTDVRLNQRSFFD